VGRGRPPSTDTLVVVAREGESLYQHHFGDVEFRVLRIVDPEDIWVRHRGVVTWFPLAGGSCDPGSDSVLVSTSWRSFHTPTVDGGISFRMRIIPVRRTGAIQGDGWADVRVLKRVGHGSSNLERDALKAEIVGVFRLEAVSLAKDSLPFMEEMRPITELRFRLLETWKGRALHIGDEIVVPKELGERTPTSWGIEGSIPMNVGDRVVLFVSRPARGQWAGRWQFPTFDGYGLLDRHGRLYCCYGQVSQEVLRRDVERAAWPLSHPFAGRIAGRVVHEPAGTPAREVRVTLLGTKFGAATDSAGLFAISGPAIGARYLRFVGPCGAASRLIEVSDEFVDSIEVRLPFSSQPCVEVRLRASPDRDELPSPPH